MLTVRLQVKGLEEEAERAAEAQRLAMAAVRGEAEEAQVRRDRGTRNQMNLFSCREADRSWPWPPRGEAQEGKKTRYEQETLLAVEMLSTCRAAKCKGSTCMKAFKFRLTRPVSVDDGTRQR